MSIERHPNFHAVQFSSDLTESFYKSLRGKMSDRKLTEDQWDLIRQKLVDFVVDVSDTVDSFCKE